MFVVTIGSVVVADVLHRPRPLGVEILGPWQESALPSVPMAFLTAILVTALYTLVPAGRLRERGKLVVAGLLAVTVLSRLYLAQEGPFDVLFAVVVGVAIPLAAFRLFVPNEVVPGQLPPRPHRAPRRHRRPARRHRPRAGGAARRDPGGDQAVQPRGLGRLHPAADHGQGRPGDLRVRQAVLGHPPALGPLVQARPYAALRPAGGREVVQHGAPAGAVRGLPAAADAGRRPAGAAAVRGRRDHPGARVPARDRVPRRRRARSAMSTSTTT